MSCPVCGEEGKKFSRHHDFEHLEPDEEWCDFCGFQYQETGDIDTYEHCIQNTVRNIEGCIDVVDDEIQWWQKFKSKIPELKKRLIKNGYFKESVR